MKSNEALQKDILETINWEPLLNTTLIKVTAKNGIVTLDGIVDLYAKKREMEIIAKNVAGVKAIVNKIQVIFDQLLHKSDNDIIAEVQHDLELRQIPVDEVKVIVKDGWVTLEGVVKWNYQIEIAKNAGNYIIGVKGITSNIKLELETHDQIEKEAIERALARNSILNIKNINVKVLADKVTLTGTVDSVYQKDEVERIVWKAPGVWNLDNQLEVKHTSEILKNIIFNNIK